MSTTADRHGHGTRLGVESSALDMAEYRIPSDEDFARADRLMAERNRHLSDVCDHLKKRFMGLYPIHNIYVLWQKDVDFRVYVFFRNDDDVNKCKSDGTVVAIENATYEELERFGRGKRDDISVLFEWDSNENVDKNFEGDYFLRLR